MATCRDCAHYDIDAFKMANGKLRVLQDKPARCLFDMARIERKMPACVTAHYSYPKHGLARSRMTPNDGNSCPQWTARRLAAIDAVLAKLTGDA